MGAYMTYLHVLALPPRCCILMGRPLIRKVAGRLRICMGRDTCALASPRACMISYSCFSRFFNLFDTMSGAPPPPPPSPAGADAGYEPSKNDPLVTGVAAASIAVVTVAVALRLYTRKFVLNILWIDDHMAVLSWASVVTMAVTNCLLVRDGLGLPPLDILPGKAMAFGIEMYLGLVMTTVACLFTKLTFFFQFYRIIRNTHAQLRLPYIVTMSLIAAWSVSQTLVTAIPCIPVKAFWDRSIAAKCIDENMKRWMNSIGNIVTDFIILVLPVPVLWRIRLPAGQKWALGGVFGLGLLVCLISILRVVITGPSNEANTPPDASLNVVWTMAEVATGLLVSCLSTYRPLMSKYLPPFRTLLSLGTLGRSRTVKTDMELTYARSKHAGVTTTTSSKTSGVVWLSLSDNASIDKASPVDVSEAPASQDDEVLLGRATGEQLRL
ncbi:hypothetical protein BJ170DRAFT_105591 [Xylariales sp. AK1849]|nr:hypothetical protein BJ170DRAFT_105591 [Xylariales sp. AK1849]